MSVSLLSAGVWLPDGFESAEEISKKSDIPLDVIKSKMGIIRKCRARADEHPSMMAVEAAKIALEGIDPNSIDLVIWTGSEHKDYPVWSAGIFIQRELGLQNAWAFDMSARCSSNVVGLKIAKNMLIADPTLNRVLLAGGHRTGDLVNYKDPTSRFLYNLSDGGSAIVIERGNSNPVLESSVITDGDFSLDVIVPAGGTKEMNRDLKSHDNTFLTCPDISGMRTRLAERSIQNFLKVINVAAKASMPKPIDYLGLLHMKKSAHDAIVDSLEMNADQAIYLDHFGHFGAPDQILSLGLAEKRGLLKKGDHICLASAGIGYTWSAISMRWDKEIFKSNHLTDLG